MIQPTGDLYQCVFQSWIEVEGQRTDAKGENLANVTLETALQKLKEFKDGEV
jgi:hypothetical protein